MKQGSYYLCQEIPFLLKGLKSSTLLVFSVLDQSVLPPDVLHLLLIAFKLFTRRLSTSESLDLFSLRFLFITGNHFDASLMLGVGVSELLVKDPCDDG